MSHKSYLKNDNGDHVMLPAEVAELLTVLEDKAFYGFGWSEINFSFFMPKRSVG